MKRWLIAPILIAAIAAIAAACGGDDNNDDLVAKIDVLRAEVAETNALATEALLRASLPALEVARFHEMDERINNEGFVHATDPGFLQRAEQVLSSSVWPDALAPNVEQFRDAVADAVPPVLDNDPDGAGRLVLIAHVNAHEFEGAVSAYFSGDEVPPPPDLGDGGEHEHAADDDGNDHSADDFDEDVDHEENEDDEDHDDDDG